MALAFMTLALWIPLLALASGRTPLPDYWILADIIVLVVGITLICVEEGRR